MVKQASLTFGVVLIGISLSAYPVWADSILEQMQNEVANVAGKARGCIVSIEDARAVVVSYTNSSLEKADLQNQMAHLEIDKKAAKVQAELAESKYRAGLMTVMDVEKPRRELARLDTRLTYLQQKLANFGREDTATRVKRDLDARIAELEADQKSYAEQIKILQQRVAAGVETPAELQASEQQQAHILQDLTTAREQRKAGAQNTNNSIIFRWDNIHFDTPKSGSGFSVGNGYIVTTADVVQGMSSPIVTADDGRRIRAILVAVDGERNVGLVKLASNVALPGLTLGDSDRVMPGHFAISIGNQAGQYNSVAFGVVSGVRMEGFYSGTHFYPTLLQVDGAVGAGTSGAPILNARGEVIGMIAAMLAPEVAPSASSGYVDPSFQTLNGTVSQNLSLNTVPPTEAQIQTFVKNQSNGSQTTSRNSAEPSASANRSARGANNRNALPDKQNRSQIGAQYNQASNRNVTSMFGAGQTVSTPRPLTAAAGTGFAVPVNAMKDVIEELKAGKDIVHPWLGVALDDVDDVREDKGTIRLNRQARLRGIYANSPASKVGMQPGDILVSLDGKPVHTTSAVRAAILPMKVGQKVLAIVQRASKPITLNLTLEVQPTPRPNLLPNGPVFQLQNPFSAEKKKSPAAP